MALTDAHRALLDGKNFATIATVNPDGSPHTSVVWVKRDGDDVLVSTVVGRKKDRNLRKDPRISISVLDHANPYRYAEFRGTATLSLEGGFDLINELSHKYVGVDYRGDVGTDNVRVIVRLSPTKITGNA